MEIEEYQKLTEELMEKYGHKKRKCSICDKIATRRSEKENFCLCEFHYWNSKYSLHSQPERLNPEDANSGKI